MKNTFWLIYCSIKLDLRLFQFPVLNTIEKIEFLTKKYITVIRHIFAPFVFGKFSIKALNLDVTYESKYGLTLFQSILIRHHKQLIDSEISDIRVCIDIGANIGYFSYLISRMFPLANIYAIEPIPETYSALKTLTKNIPKIHTSPIAISDINGNSKMSRDMMNAATSTMDEFGDLEVSTLSLDSFVYKNKIDEIDLLKIDVESHELNVLRGAYESLKKTRYLLIEITLGENRNYTMSSLFKQLCTSDFDFQLVTIITYPHVSEGKVTMLDCLLYNTKK